MLRFLMIVATALAVAGCTGDAGTRFHNTDLTGAAYGKSLSLLDHHGKPTTLADFKGKVVTLFFGFTQCPDVCPTSLSTMSEVMRRLGEDADRVQVLFVTVDPERDTAELLQAYVPAFDPRFVGLYGDLDQIAEAAREFKVFYRKSGDVEGMNYTIDHSAGTYVFDPTGRLRLYIKHAETAENIVGDIRLLLSGK